VIILEDQWKCAYKGVIIIFNVRQNRVVWKPEDFFCRAMGLLDLRV
jgi:hypothetical protein